MGPLHREPRFGPSPLLCSRAHVSKHCQTFSSFLPLFPKLFDPTSDEHLFLYFKATLLFNNTGESSRLGAGCLFFPYYLLMLF